MLCILYPYALFNIAQRPAPPDAEWWDAGLLPNQTYDDLDLGFETLKITTTDSPITMYIQHPIPIPAPGDKNTVALKPMMLTKKVGSISVPSYVYIDIAAVF